MNIQHKNDDYCVLGSKLKSQGRSSAGSEPFASPILWDAESADPAAIDRLVMSSSLASILSGASMAMGNPKPLKKVTSSKRRPDNSFINSRPRFSLLPGIDDSEAIVLERATISNNNETILSSHENWAIMPRLHSDPSEKCQRSELVCELLEIPSSSRKRRTYYPSLNSNKRQRRFPKVA
eukprot:CAMPEP_0117001974 /NCGR_PEP_ID=MMETSP0472-20121206/3795_1 /TAXON_ID=693140 ORGANISM="Tiarina fusus, Strain LIS" /NCGR_SAMPLE_ID=MMETSP0472 /ASSEMBLY_ACC=CAM_ASM_000603 /LENGTH=179 /DNA_ID=CAMNT_0004702161 /DNA_START=56 /DNA_END=595 /DNA_ORIENTATION=+